MKNILYFFMSLCFHASIIGFILIVINMKQENKKNNIGNTEKVYLVKEDTSVIPRRDRRIPILKLKKKTDMDPAIASQDDGVPKDLLTRQIQSKYEVIQKGKNDDLLIYLHNIIQKQCLLYQDELFSLGKKAVMVEFDLSPDGKLSNIIIQDDMSEETKQEFISIIQSASPLTSIPASLKETEHFSLQVKVS